MGPEQGDIKTKMILVVNEGSIVKKSEVLKFTCQFDVKPLQN